MCTDVCVCMYTYIYIYIFTRSTLRFETQAKAQPGQATALCHPQGSPAELRAQSDIALTAWLLQKT